MKIDGAVDVHFGANQGAVPREFYVTAKEGPSEDDDRDLLVGAVFAVRGRDEDFKLFKGSSREPPPKRARGMPRPKAQQPAAPRIECGRGSSSSAPVWSSGMPRAPRSSRRRTLLYRKARRRAS